MAFLQNCANRGCWFYFDRQKPSGYTERVYVNLHYKRTDVLISVMKRFLADVGYKQFQVPAYRRLLW